LTRKIEGDTKSTATLTQYHKNKNHAYKMGVDIKLLLGTLCKWR